MIEKEVMDDSSFERAGRLLRQLHMRVLEGEVSLHIAVSDKEDEKSRFLFKWKFRARPNKPFSGEPMCTFFFVEIEELVASDGIERLAERILADWIRE